MTESRFESLQARADLLAAMRDYLDGKDGPLRLEKIASRVAGQPWNLMSAADRRVIAGTLGRCGFTSTAWPLWHRATEADAALEAVPPWITRRAAA